MIFNSRSSFGKEGSKGTIGYFRFVSEDYICFA